ncbi:hypothetical protein E1A91_A02G065300v1, partial [Gossypium mustelinum]
LPLFVFRCRNLHCTNWQRCSSSSLEVIPYNQNHLRRITCSKTKLQVDIETKDQSGTAIQIHLKETLLFWRAMCLQQKLQKMPLHH